MASTSEMLSEVEADLRELEAGLMEIFDEENINNKQKLYFKTIQEDFEESDYNIGTKKDILRFINKNKEEVVLDTLSRL